MNKIPITIQNVSNGLEFYNFLITDSNGSMSAIKDKTIDGINSTLEEQHQLDGEATVSLYEFSDDVENVFQMRPLDRAPELTEQSYRPGGSTALHDAIATAIDETAEIIEGLAEAERPETVVMVVLTDGKENASETPGEAVQERVENRQEYHGWEFLFIGANQDAALTAEQMGMDRDHARDMDHSGEGIESAYQATSQTLTRAREEGASGGFTEDERQIGEGTSTPESSEE